VQLVGRLRALRGLEEDHPGGLAVGVDPAALRLLKEARLLMVRVLGEGA
jgi:hypothetical protein